jgi:hypothetical protein
MLDISTKNSDVLLKYLGCLRNHLRRKVVLFKPRTVYKGYVQAQNLENMNKNKGQPSGSKEKDHQDASKEEKKNWKGKDNKTRSTTH